MYLEFAEPELFLVANSVQTSLFSGKSKSKNQGFYFLYLEAVSIKNSKSQSLHEDSGDSNSNARATELVDLFSFSPRDLEFIVKFSEEHGSDIFRQILQSICPSIYGHELVKGEYNIHSIHYSPTTSSPLRWLAVGTNTTVYRLIF